MTLLVDRVQNRGALFDSNSAAFYGGAVALDAGTLQTSKYVLLPWQSAPISVK